MEIRNKADDACPAPERPRRVLAYCHDSVGIGHLRRTLAICERIAVRNPTCSFLLATGTPYVPLFNESAAIDFIKLPALQKTTDGGYGAKFLPMPLDPLIRCRESMLLEAARNYDPDVLLVDKAPVGVVRELVPTLRWLAERRPQTRLVFGMRDVEDEPEATIAQWTRDGVQEVLESCYNEIWVYGMREIYDVGDRYQLSPTVREKLRYMGHIARPACNHTLPASPDKTLLVTVGGGTDGERVLRTYLECAAARVADFGVQSVVIGGPDMPPDARARLRGMASETRGVRWLDMEGCMSCRMREANWVVTMGGYNTLCELARLRKPALVIPRTKPRLEQKIRAELWQERGALTMLQEHEFDPEGLAAAVVRLVTTSPVQTTPDLDLNGLDRVEQRFSAFWEQEARHAAAIHM